LTQTDDTTTLRFVRRLSDRALAGEVVGARDGKALPSFEGYNPA
jgi:hypothetical protein